MEKVDREKFVVEIWKRYNATKDIEFLARRAKRHLFLGKKKWHLKRSNFEIGTEKKKPRTSSSRAIEGENKWWMIR